MDKKNPLNSFFFYKYQDLDLTELNEIERQQLNEEAEKERKQGGANARENIEVDFVRKERGAIRITFEERIFKLERDEQGFVN
jgi:hypothetical protein